MTPNVGNADMILGAPTGGNDHFAFSECHGHYHFEGYAEYRLRDASSKVVATGRKQAFCLLDSDRYLDEDDVGQRPRYDCEFQGIQRGWADVYHSRLPCQFIDVTEVADGDYLLEIELNNGGTLPELSHDNNLASIPIELGSGDLGSPTEPCPLDLDVRGTDGQNRECGWSSAGTFACTPGETLFVGCAAGCGDGIGSCTGDPMIRVCDAARSDGNCSFPAALGNNDDGGCDGHCPLASAVCPESGELAVFSAPFSAGDPFSCDVAIYVPGS
jgi:hypothetical protein